MTWLDLVIAEAVAARSLWVAALVLLLAWVVRALAPAEIARLRSALGLVTAHLLLIPVVAWARLHGLPAERHLRLGAQVLELLAVILAGVTAGFAFVLPRLHLRAPLILRELLVAVASTVAFFALASGAGYNLSGLIATSTVLTAIIGLSFQDTLGNAMAGLALQLDQSVVVGDWIKVGDVVGRVREIRWRFTAVETRNWETVVLPNSVLVKNQFMVIGRREGRPLQQRRFIWFNVDYRFSPTDVIETVDAALRAGALPGVAADPPAHCVLMDLSESYGRYAARYWLTDIEFDDSSDSRVRTRVYFALKRANIPLSLPAHAVFLTEESSEREARKSDREEARRHHALRQVDLFEHLSGAERSALVEHLRFTPFARGELMTRQGDPGEFLYVIIAGEASVRVGDPEKGMEVNRLHAGDFFGEMSLLTGAPRSATVVALTDTECYRLDKEAFQQIMDRRPELADKLAEVLAARRYRLQALRAGPDPGAPPETHLDLVGRIRSFFRLG